MILLKVYAKRLRRAQPDNGPSIIKMLVTLSLPKGYYHTSYI